MASVNFENSSNKSLIEIAKSSGVNPFVILSISLLNSSTYFGLDIIITCPVFLLLFLSEE